MAVRSGAISDHLRLADVRVSLADCVGAIRSLVRAFDSRLLSIHLRRIVLQYSVLADVIDAERHGHGLEQVHFFCLYRSNGLLESVFVFESFESIGSPKTVSRRESGTRITGTSSVSSADTSDTLRKHIRLIWQRAGRKLSKPALTGAFSAARPASQLCLDQERWRRDLDARCSSEPLLEATTASALPAVTRITGFFRSLLLLAPRVVTPTMGIPVSHNVLASDYRSVRMSRPGRAMPAGSARPRR